MELSKKKQHSNYDDDDPDDEVNLKRFLVFFHLTKNYFYSGDCQVFNGVLCFVFFYLYIVIIGKYFNGER